MGLGILSVLTSTKIIPGHWGIFEWMAQLHQLVAMLLLLSLVQLLFLINQVGRGDGNTAATVAGAVIGGMVGNRIGQDQVNQNVQTQCNNYPVQKQVGEVVTVQYKGRLYSFEARY